MDQYDVAVIGSGPGGYVAAIRAAQLGLKAVCIEKSKALGGTCLNVGCIPSKALLQSSEWYNVFTHEAKDHGVYGEGVSFDFAKMMQRKKGVVDGFVQGIAYLFKKNQVTRIQGTAALRSANEISIDGKTSIAAKNIILATGSEAIALSFLPFDEQKILSSTGVLSLSKVPKTMLIVGAGIIGLELGSVYRRLGTKVQFIEFLDRIAPNMDPTISETLQKILEKQGMEFHLSHKVVSGKAMSSGVELMVESQGHQKAMQGDVALIAIGRRPFSKGLGLENAGIETDSKGFVPVDANFRTTAENIFAIGDLIDGPMLAHKASEEGMAVAEILGNNTPAVNYFTIPNVAYTYPEVASVGLTEPQAKEKGLSIRISKIPMKANSRARCSGEEEGLVKMIMEEKSGQLIGIHIISANASELIAEATVILENKMTAKQVAHTCHAHPTIAEAIKEAALALTSGAIHL